MESQRVISLNVSGQLFTTSLATLKAVPESTLATMFSGAGLAKMAVDEAGRFFIDRDPKVHMPFHMSSRSTQRVEREGWLAAKIAASHAPCVALSTAAKT